MKTNCHSNNLTLKNLLSNVGSLTRYRPLHYESRITSKDRIPFEMASCSRSIIVVYSATLFEDGWRHTPLKTQVDPRVHK